MFLYHFFSKRRRQKEVVILARETMVESVFLELCRPLNVSKVFGKALKQLEFM